MSAKSALCLSFQQAPPQAPEDPIIDLIEGLTADCYTTAEVDCCYHIRNSGVMMKVCDSSDQTKVYTCHGTNANAEEETPWFNKQLPAEPDDTPRFAKPLQADAVTCWYHPPVCTGDDENPCDVNEDVSYDDEWTSITGGADCD